MASVVLWNTTWKVLFKFPQTNQASPNWRRCWKGGARQRAVWWVRSNISYAHLQYQISKGNNTSQRWTAWPWGRMWPWCKVVNFVLVVCFLRKTLHVNLTILFYSYHLLDKARFCDLTFFNHKYGHKFNEKYFYLIFAGAPLMSEWVRSWLGKHPSGVMST